ncbi:adenosine deaminase [Paenibacillus sp. GCM10027627]|uniref:adenosine deaminase n=1 Tax=unclassified Paenibacillus TaxID=185978 RepID=UPI003631753C
MNDRILSLPKVDLHVHLDGSVLPDTVIDLAEKSGIALPASDADALLPYMKVEGECLSLSDYLSKFQFVGQFLHTPYSLERVAYELVQQAAEQNCRYIEVRFAPQLHRQQGLSVEEVIHHAVLGLQRGEAEFGIVARCIAICLRGHSEELNRETVEAAASFLGRGVVAVDLAGSEAAYPADLYQSVFELARERGIPITIHAGEAAGAESVRSAVQKLGASRIGHGVRMKEDPELVELILQKRIPLELCPVSNLQTKASESWAMYPLREYFELGVVVTVNTDNLTVSGTTISEEYRILQEELHFTEKELVQIVKNGVEAAFLQGEDRLRLQSDMELQLSRWLNSGR